MSRPNFNISNEVIYNAIQAVNVKVSVLQLQLAQIRSIVSQSQGDIDNATTVITGLLTDLGNQDASILADVQSLLTQIANGQPVDTSALDTIVAKVAAAQSETDSAVGTLNTAANPAPPATPTA